jgi:hypothetical protein
MLNTGNGYLTGSKSESAVSPTDTRRPLPLLLSEARRGREEPAGAELDNDDDLAEPSLSVNKCQIDSRHQEAKQEVTSVSTAVTHNALRFIIAPGNIGQSICTVQLKAIFGNQLENANRQLRTHHARINHMSKSSNWIKETTRTTIPPLFYRH